MYMLEVLYIARELEVNKVLENFDDTGKSSKITDNKYIVAMFTDIVKYIVNNKSSFLKADKNKIEESKKLEVMYEYSASDSVKVLAFDTVYYMMKIFKDVLYKIKDGYTESRKHMKLAGFTSTIETKLDVLVFLVFLNDFPIALRETVIKTVKLRNAPLNDILDKCNQGIVNTYKKLCSTLYDTIQPKDGNPTAKYLATHKYVNFDTEPGFMSLLSIITRLRQFSK